MRTWENLAVDVRVCRGLILQSTFYSLPSLASSRFIYLHLYPRFLFPANSLESNLVLGKPAQKAPVCLIHGAVDKIIPAEQSSLLYRKVVAGKKLYLVPGAGHNDIQSTYMPILSRYIADSLAFIEQKESLRMPCRLGQAANQRVPSE